MALNEGSTLGTYEILGSLGAGGMGEVYRARDSKLGRSVAVKVLPEAFAADSDRVPRFEREAKVLASLNHPHIAALYGMEQGAGASNAHFLIMELVEGETLLERLQRGALSVVEALAIAIQIAEALEYAHEQGVVHRDLKPANVKITPDDKVKVLDFGLAKAMDTSPAASSPAHSPTLSVLATQAGLIMGTAAYMSPEQAKGLATDRRSDVFSFGVVLYELLTARQPFSGETGAEIMAAVMLREADLTVLPAGINPRIRELIARCIEKNPKKRWQAMGDLRLELESLIAAPHQTTTSNAGQTVPVASPLWKRAIPIAAAVLVTAIVSIVTTRWLTPPPPSRAAFRFTIPPSPSINQSFQSLAWSPDGSRLVYLTQSVQGERRLMLRTMGDLEARPIAGASGQVSSPAFSPDGQFVAFFSATEGVLKKIAINGGAAVTLCKMTVPYSGPAWHPSGIVFAQTNGVMRVSADGGEPELIVKIGDGERIAAPQLIDDRGTLLFSYTTDALLSAGWDKGQVIVQSADGTRQVIASGSDARYLTSGHILYMSGSTLMGVAFDAGTRRVRGSPVPVVEGIARGMSQLFAGHYAVSTSGALAYVAAAPAGAAASRTLAFVDMNGRAQPLAASPKAYEHPRASPDGMRVAVATDDGKEAVIWIYDLSGDSVPRRLTFEGRNSAPIWSPDRQSITFQSNREGRVGLFRQRADGSGTAERLTTAEPTRSHVPESWSPDGKTLTFRVTGDGISSIWTWSSDGDRTPKLLVQGAPSAVTSAISPDGRWLAYGSNELGTTAFQVFVQPLPTTGAKFQVNPMTSSTPVWSPDRKRLFFAFSDRIFSAAIQTTPAFAAGQPVEIKMPNIMASFAQIRHFDLMPDGKHFLVVIPADADSAQQNPAQINIVLNWLDELKAKTAAQP